MSSPVNLPTTVPKKRADWRNAASVFLLLIAMLSFGFTGAWLQDKWAQGSGDLSQEKRVVSNESRLFNQIAREVGPSVVSVNAAIGTGDGGLFNSGETIAEGAGTGIILSSDGYVMTNRHVVPEGTQEVSVTLSDGTELKDVTVVGRTTENDSLDIAFLKINDLKGAKLTPAKIGDSSKVLVGDNVVAIGNALGQFQNTVTSGIISGYGRSVQAGNDSGTSIENLDDLFQTDAAINEGNSGGPLVNMDGEVIGINTAVAGGGAENIGFSIPINNTRGIIDQVLDTGEFTRPYLGVRYVPLTADIAKQEGLKVSEGAYILPSQDEFNSSVLPGSPADKAGLKQKDVITRVNDKKVDQKHSLTSLLGVYKPGDKVQIEIQRGNDKKTIQVTLDKLPD